MKWRAVMSKELTPLQEIKKPIWIEYTENSDNDKLCYRRYQVDIIETALKRLEKIETTTPSVLREDISNKLKAFTLLDDCDIDVWLIKHCDYENYCRVRTLCLKATGNADVDDANREVINLPTEKEYDFLKEILK